MGKFLGLVAVAAVLMGTVLFQAPVEAKAKSDTVVEQWVNANHLRIRVNGKWEDIPLVPLADHLCKSGHRMFRKYCVGTSQAPAKR